MVLGRGVAILDRGDDRSCPIHRPSLCAPIENDDRVFRIERGTVVVKYMPFQTATLSLSMLARKYNCRFFLL
jgi:hypothetical protein